MYPSPSAFNLSHTPIPFDPLPHAHYPNLMPTLILHPTPRPFPLSRAAVGEGEGPVKRRVRSHATPSSLRPAPARPFTPTPVGADLRVCIRYLSDPPKLIDQVTLRPNPQAVFPKLTYCFFLLIVIECFHWAS